MVVIDIKDLPSWFNRIERNLLKQVKRVKVQAPRKAGTYMVKQAMKMAPHQSGETERGIKGKKHGKGYAVISSVDNVYPQNVFADNRIVGTKGQVPYRWVQKTGVSGGGFFTKAELMTAKKYNELVIKDVSEWEIVK